MKTAKTIYLIAIIFITVVVVAFFGGRKIKAFRGLFTDVDVVKDSATLEPFKEIELDANAVNFTVVDGEDYHVDYEYPSYMTLKGDVDHETLKIELKGKQKDSFGFLRLDKGGLHTVEPRITVTVPKGSELAKMYLKINAGNVTLSKRIIEELDVDCDAGNFNINEITSNKVKVLTEAGNIEIDDSTLGDCEFGTSAGRISVDETVMNNVTVETNMGEINFDGTTFAKGEAESNMGSVKIDGNFEELKCNTNMGEISVDSESIDNAKLDLSVDLGEVKVNGNSKGSSFVQK